MWVWTDMCVHPRLASFRLKNKTLSYVDMCQIRGTPTTLAAVLSAFLLKPTLNSLPSKQTRTSTSIGLYVKPGEAPLTHRAPHKLSSSVKSRASPFALSGPIGVQQQCPSHSLGVQLSQGSTCVSRG